MMRIEKTNTGIIIHEPTDEVKEKVLEYFALEDPTREYFIYSGNDPNHKPRFGKERDVIYISSGFLKIDDPDIKHLHVFKTIPPATPKPCKIVMNREPRSDLQRDCIKMMTTSDSPKITIELKPGVELFRHPRTVTCVQNSPLNCWDILILMILKHDDEICVSVNVTKVERNSSVDAWSNPKHQIMDNQQRSSE